MKPIFWPVARDGVIGRGPVGLEIRCRNELAIVLLDHPLGGDAGQEGVLAQHVLGAHGHQLDEAQQQAFFIGVLDQRHELAFRLVFHQHAVQMDGAKPGGDGRVNAFQNLWQQVAPCRLLVDRLIEESREIFAHFTPALTSRAAMVSPCSSLLRSVPFGGNAHTAQCPGCGRSARRNQ